MDWQALKAADAALGIDDPAATAAALNAQTVMVTADVPTAEIRAVLWPTLDYAELDLRAAAARANPPTDPQARALAKIAITAVSLLNSDRVIRADDPTAWAGVIGGLQAWVAAGAVPQASLDAVAALRRQPVSLWQPPLDAGIIQTARLQP